MTRTLPLIATASIGALLLVSGCGGGSDSSSGGGAYGSGSESSAETAKSEAGKGKESTASIDGVIAVASNPKLGKILVNDLGMTLYDFHKDKGGASACYGECAAIWPPMLTTAAGQVASPEADQELGTTKRKDGTLQVTYAGHPLYTYVVDKKPGEANGNDFSSFGGQWYALKPNGEEAGG